MRDASLEAISEAAYSNSSKAQRLPRQHRLLHRGSGFESVRAREGSKALTSSGDVGRLLRRALGRFEGQSFDFRGLLRAPDKERGRRDKA